jgi:hypothetical protein
MSQVGRARAHDVAPGHATSASPPYRRARMAEQACDRRSEARLREHCVPTGRDSLPTPRPVPRGHNTLAPARAAFRHWPSAGRTSPTAFAPCRRHYGSRSSGEAASRRSWPIKTPRVVSLRAPVSNLSAAVAISAAVVNLPPACSPGWPSLWSPSQTSQSLHDHIWLSSPLTFRRERRRRGGAVVASPPAITGLCPGQVSDTNRPLVSPIEPPARLFASPGPTSPPASAPPPSGYGWGGPRSYL